MLVSIILGLVVKTWWALAIGLAGLTLAVVPILRVRSSTRSAGRLQTQPGNNRPAASVRRMVDDDSRPAPAGATRRVDRTGQTVNEMNADDATRLAALVTKLSEYGDGRAILLRQPYYEAVDETAKLGAIAVPTLMDRLGSGRLIALALGKIGTKPAFDALATELRSPDWRRVEAAADGLGASRNVAAIPILEAARAQAHQLRIAEVSNAFASALADLEKVRAGDKWLQVDRSRPWQQISMVQSQLKELQNDEAKRQQGIQWCKDMIAALPELTVQIPGANFTPADAKSRAWSVLAVTIYYLLNPSKSVINSPCAEAKYCWEQALKLMPGDSYFGGCLKSVA